MKAHTLFGLAVLALTPHHVIAGETQSGERASVSDGVIGQQRETLARNTEGKGFGPQSPRDIESTSGSNNIVFSSAPAYSRMNLCSIHFHKHAEHKGGEFTKYAGNGDGRGYNTGYQYAGDLTTSELAPVEGEACPSEHGSLKPGDTIEVHYVHSTAQVSPGPTLGSCLDESIKNPQLRVETQVYVLVNDEEAGDFEELAEHGKKNGFYQAMNIPDATGAGVEYAGSTTGPDYNEKGSPFQVTWNVRPEVAKVDVESVGAWCEDNGFDEDHAHGVRRGKS